MSVYADRHVPPRSSHTQFDAMLVDYLHPRKFPTLGPIVTWGLRAATSGVLVGVYQFNTNDIGE